MKKIIFTNHAIEQAKQRCGISEEKAREVLADTREIELPPRLWGYKLQRYGTQIINTHYLYSESHITAFNIIEKKDCFLILTVVKKKYKNVKYIPDGLELNHE